MNNFLKTAYTAGAQQALVDYGVEKQANVLLRNALMGGALGTGAGALGAGEDHRASGALLGGLTGALAGGVGGKLLHELPGVLRGKLPELAENATRTERLKHFLSKQLGTAPTMARAAESALPAALAPGAAVLPAYLMADNLAGEV